MSFSCIASAALVVSLNCCWCSVCSSISKRVLFDLTVNSCVLQRDRDCGSSNSETDSVASEVSLHSTTSLKLRMMQRKVNIFLRLTVATEQSEVRICCGLTRFCLSLVAQIGVK